ncbi:hypothetical protein [Phenylobacterium sp.]|jgi:hypothetical protein|uniref:hypothetical protein n=1 Tax=Phenylobacterium sp. TaxID=1871053 RepID=UPI0037C84F95
MRLILAVTLLASVVTSGAAACDYHGGGDDYYDGYARYGSLSMNREKFYALQAIRAAEREQAMETARQSFLARFDVRADQPVETASLNKETKPRQDADADRSARAYAQDR